VPNGVELADGRIINAELVVWAAGVKAPAFLENLDGLETNAINQLVVRQTLQTTRDDDIFAIGDCAACPWRERNAIVPPRAQAAHQQSTHLAKQLPRKLAGQQLAPWHYRDFSSLVSLGEYSTVGSLMGKLVGRNLFVEGHFCTVDVCVALQNARICAARLHQGRTRYRGAHHQPAHRAAGQAALR
jgi:NADH:ubiquinone reductase (H+-translocating)